MTTMAASEILDEGFSISRKVLDKAEGDHESSDERDDYEQTIKIAVLPRRSPLLLSAFQKNSHKLPNEPPRKRDIKVTNPLLINVI